MNNFHGIIYAYHDFPELRELGAKRTGSALPFAARYRLIDFALSSFMNAGIFDVGVIMQRDYQSLLDHLGGGKNWDMARRLGGLKLLPPFAVPGHQQGIYEGCMEALYAVRSYIGYAQEDYFILTRGDLCANLDLRAAAEQHLASGADITAICSDTFSSEDHVRYVQGEDGFVKEMLIHQSSETKGVASLESYIISRELLLELISYCSEGRRLHWHRDAIDYAINSGKKIGIYMHEGYANIIDSVEDYYSSNMDMLSYANRHDILGSERPVHTSASANTSTYYGPESKISNCLVADGCYIEGSIKNCIVFPGVKIGKGAIIEDSIIMHDTEIGDGAIIKCAISDKGCIISPWISLIGSRNLPIVIPKQAKI